MKRVYQEGGKGWAVAVDNEEIRDGYFSEGPSVSRCERDTGNGRGSEIFNKQELTERTRGYLG